MGGQSKVQTLVQEKIKEIYGLKHDLDIATKELNTLRESKEHLEKYGAICEQRLAMIIHIIKEVVGIKISPRATKDEWKHYFETIACAIREKSNKAILTKNKTSHHWIIEDKTKIRCQCGQTFQQPKNISRHLSESLRGKIFGCLKERCTYKVARSSHLLNHYKKHGLQTSSFVVCAPCKESSDPIHRVFKSFDDLRSHVDSFHLNL